MKNVITLAALLSTLLLQGCAGAVMDAIPTDDGYQLRTIYGGIDGSQDQAAVALNEEAARLCAGAFIVVKDVIQPRKIANTEFFRRVQCAH